MELTHDGLNSKVKDQSYEVERESINYWNWRTVANSLDDMRKVIQYIYVSRITKMSVNTIRKEILLMLDFERPTHQDRRESYDWPRWYL